MRWRAQPYRSISLTFEAITLYLLLGALAGVLAGLLGIGGGLVLVAALVWILPQQGIRVDDAMHVALASSMACIVLTTMSSAHAHHRRGSVVWPTVAWLVPGMLLGGVLGSRLAIELDGDVLRWCVAVYCLLSAAQLLFGKTRVDLATSATPVGPAYTAAGVGIGALSAVVGIGGGSMTVPLLVWRGMVPVRAVGTSSACGVFIGIAAAVGYAAQAPTAAVALPGAVGYVYLPAAIAMAVASVLTAPVGTRLAHRLPPLVLKKVFAGFLLLIALNFILLAPGS